jgi:hypothetical protein
MSMRGSDELLLSLFIQFDEEVREKLVREILLNHKPEPTGNHHQVIHSLDR